MVKVKFTLCFYIGYEQVACASFVDFLVEKITRNMSAPPHHFIPGLNAQSGMRNQFGSGPMQNQMGGGMQSQLANQLTNQMPVPMPNQMPPQMNNPIMSQMANTLNNQINAGMTTGNQMMAQINQQYNSINGPTNQIPQHQTPTPMQMPQPAMGMYFLFIFLINYRVSKINLRLTLENLMFY